MRVETVVAHVIAVGDAQHGLDVAVIVRYERAVGGRVGNAR